MVCPTKENIEAVRWLATYLEYCLDQHDDCPTPDQSFMPTRILCIDEHKENQKAFRLRLVNTTESTPEPYAAVSYCWGGDQVLKLTPLIQPRLSIGIASLELPATLRDACIIAIELKIQYIWIDALCIFQGDNDDKIHEVKKMDQIYANATITIAASRAASASEGFLATIPGPLPPPPEHTEPLNARAWALQEAVLSPRLLEFRSYGQPALFSCRTAVSSFVEKDLQDRNSYTIAQFAHNLGRRNTVPEAWGRLVHKFTSRQLSVPTDRYPAFQGVISSMTGRMGVEGRHICASGVWIDPWAVGEWDRLTLTCLLWRRSGPLKEARLLPAMQKPHPTPSWSWVKMCGSVAHINGSEDLLSWKQIFGGSNSLRWLPHSQGVTYGVLAIQGIAIPGTWSANSGLDGIDFLDDEFWIQSGHTVNIHINLPVIVEKQRTYRPNDRINHSTLVAFGLKDVASTSDHTGDHFGTACRRKSVLLVPMIAATKKEGLILEDTGRGTYRRIGVFGNLHFPQGKPQVRPTDKELAEWFPQRTLFIE